MSSAARVEPGYLLGLVQEGVSLGMPQSRPLPQIGPRCHELRVRDEDTNWRIIYRIDDRAILVVDIFKKKSATTPKRVIEACNRRLRAYDPKYRKVDMKTSKKKEIERGGWKIGTVQELLGLTDEEATYVELKLALSRALRQRRQKHKVTQVQLAKKIGSSQSRVAKMEAGDPSVSIDLLIRSLIALGATPEAVARSIRSAK